MRVALKDDILREIVANRRLRQFARRRPRRKLQDARGIQVLRRFDRRRPGRDLGFALRAFRGAVTQNVQPPHLAGEDVFLRQRLQRKPDYRSPARAGLG